LAMLPAFVNGCPHQDRVAGVPGEVPATLTRAHSVSYYLR
jgi:hypothetical protein